MLELGAIVQAQVTEMFIAISCGDVKKVVSMVDGGDFFGPCNTTKLRTQMDEQLELAQILMAQTESNQKDVDNQKYLIHSIRERTATAHARVAKAEKDYKDAQSQMLFNDNSMSSRFTAFEEISQKLVPNDLWEISNITRPDELTRWCALAFGLLVGSTLNVTSNYDVSKQSAKIWFDS